MRPHYRVIAELKFRATRPRYPPKRNVMPMVPRQNLKTSVAISVEKRVVRNRILVVQRLELAEVAHIGAQAEMIGEEDIGAAPEVVAGIVAIDVVEDVARAAQLGADGPGAGGQIGVEAEAARAADRDGDNHVGHQRLDARVKVEDVKFVRAAGELEEVGRDTVIDLESEDPLAHVGEAAAEADALLELVIEIVQHELIGGAAEDDAQVRRQQPVGSRRRRDGAEKQHQQCCSQ